MVYTPGTMRLASEAVLKISFAHTYILTILYTYIQKYFTQSLYIGIPISRVHMYVCKSPVSERMLPRQTYPLRCNLAHFFFYYCKIIKGNVKKLEAINFKLLLL